MEHTPESDKVLELARERASIMADLESCTDELKRRVRSGIASGRLSELGVSTLTGISRTTIRTWVHKT